MFAFFQRVQASIKESLDFSIGIDWTDELATMPLHLLGPSTAPGESLPPTAHSSSALSETASSTSSVSSGHLASVPALTLPSASELLALPSAPALLTPPSTPELLALPSEPTLSPRDTTASHTLGKQEIKTTEKVVDYFTSAVNEYKSNQVSTSYHQLIVGMHAYLIDCDKLSMEENNAVWDTFRNWVQFHFKHTTLIKVNIKKSKIYLNESIDKFEKGKYPEALDFASQCINHSVAYSEGYYLAARCYLKQRKQEEAYVFFQISRWLNINHGAIEKDKKKLKENAEYFIAYSESIRQIEIEIGMLEQAKETNLIIEDKFPIAFPGKKEMKTNNRILFSQKLLEKSKSLSNEDDFESALSFSKAAMEVLEEYQPCYKRVYIEASLFTAKLLHLLEEKKEAKEVLTKTQVRFPDNLKIKNRLDRLVEKAAPVVEETKEPKKSTSSSSKMYVPQLKRKPRPHFALIDPDQIIAEKKEKEERKKQREKAEEDRKIQQKEKIAQCETRKKTKRKNRHLRVKERREEAKSKSSTQTVLHSLEMIRKTDKPLSSPEAAPSAMETKTPHISETPKKSTNDFLDFKTFPIAYKISPLQSFERRIIQLLGNKCCLTGSAVRERTRLKMQGAPPIYDMNQDRDFVASCSDEEIMSALSEYNVTRSKKPGLYFFHACDVHGNQFKVEIFCTVHTSMTLDNHHRDYTVNGVYADADGNVIDPSGRAITDIETNTLRTIKPPKESYTEDPWRVFRGAELALKNEMKIDPDTENEMKAHFPSLKKMKEFHSVHAWMMKTFSCFGIDREKSTEKFRFLIDNHIFSHLFDSQAEKIIQDESEWILHVLQSDYMNSKQQIYMVFYVSLAAKLIPKLGEKNYQRYIFSAYPILEDVLSGFGRFGAIYRHMLKERDQFYKSKTATVEHKPRTLTA